jgi:hypothetical protein
MERKRVKMEQKSGRVQATRVGCLKEQKDTFKSPRKMSDGENTLGKTPGI